MSEIFFIDMQRPLIRGLYIQFYHSALRFVISDNCTIHLLGLSCYNHWYILS